MRRVAFAVTALALVALAASAAPKLKISTTSLPPPIVGVSYSQTLMATGGDPPYKWTTTNGSLPKGLSLAPAGSITGMPTTVETANFTVRVADSGTDNDTQPLSLSVNAALQITTASLPNATVGAQYTQMLAASGGSGTYSWSLVGGSLPGGLSLSPLGQISGTPNAAGGPTFTVRVSDGAGQSVQKALSITVTAALTIGTASLPDGVVGIAYSQPLSATGGTPPYTWTVASGTLPAGITLSGATISGMPSTAGTASFTVRVTDSANASAQKPLAINIAAAVAITTTTLPDGGVGVPYSQSLTATGGSGTYIWSIATGPLPPGLTLTGARIAGTPTTAGQYPFTVKVTDGTTSAQ
ncbi:MAG TPA: putative Ig domain-containing protein, partial [Bryobacteraceae bacterium]